MIDILLDFLLVITVLLLIFLLVILVVAVFALFVEEGLFDDLAEYIVRFNRRWKK